MIDEQPNPTFWTGMGQGCGITDSFTRVTSVGQIWDTSGRGIDWGGWGTSDSGHSWIYDSDYWGNDEADTFQLSVDGAVGAMEWMADAAAHWVNTPTLVFDCARAQDVTATIHIRAAQIATKTNFGDPFTWGTSVLEFFMFDGDAEIGPYRTRSLISLNLNAYTMTVDASFSKYTFPPNNQLHNSPNIPVVEKSLLTTGFWIKLHGTADGGDVKFWWDDEAEPGSWTYSFHGFTGNGNYYRQVQFIMRETTGWSVEGGLPWRFEFDNLDIEGVNRCRAIECPFDDFNRTVSPDSLGIASSGTMYSTPSQQGANASLSVNGSQAVMVLGPNTFPNTWPSIFSDALLPIDTDTFTLRWLFTYSGSGGGEGSSSWEGGVALTVRRGPEPGNLWYLDITVHRTGPGAVYLLQIEEYDGGGNPEEDVLGASTAVDITSGTPFFMEASFTPLHVDVRVWIASGSRPDVPTASLDVRGAWGQGAISGTRTGLWGAVAGYPTGTYDLMCDYVELEALGGSTSLEPPDEGWGVETITATAGPGSSSYFSTGKPIAAGSMQVHHNGRLLIEHADWDVRDSTWQSFVVTKSIDRSIPLVCSYLVVTDQLRTKPSSPKQLSANTLPGKVNLSSKDIRGV